jgi:hypothetical protein
MNPIQHLAGQYLNWTQPPMFSKEYELHDAEGVQLLGQLKWESEWVMRATAIAGEKQWHFDRVGFMSRVEVREGTKEGVLIATIKRGWTYNGTLNYEDGRQFKWKNANMWQTTWKWQTVDEGDIMTFSSVNAITRITRSEAKIELTGAAADFPEVDLLATLGWYLMIVQAMDSAAAAAS